MRKFALPMLLGSALIALPVVAAVPVSRRRYLRQGVSQERR
jgi:hypothetical protein